MPIKFGDLIENANSSYAVIDLTDNQSRGVAFIDGVGELTGTISANINAISQDKRQQGMLLVTKDTAEVYLLESAPNVDVDGTETGDIVDYSDGLFGIAPGEVGSPWKEIGSLELQTSNIEVNIDDAFNGSGKTFGKYHPGYSQLVGNTIYTGIIPVEHWMDEKSANPAFAVVASSQGATALEIIRDALNESFPLVPVVTSSVSSVPFNEQSFTSTFTVNVEKANDVNITEIEIQYRESGTSTWTTFPGGTFGEAQINNSQATATVTLSNALMQPDGDFFNFAGYDIRANATDASGSTGVGETNITRDNYQSSYATIVSTSRVYNNNTFAKNETDTLRVTGNVDTTITFNVSISQANDSTIKDGQHYYTVYRREKINSDEFGAWSALGSASSFAVSDYAATGLSYTDDGAPAASVYAQEVQYKVVISDLYTNGEGVNLLNNYAWSTFATGYDDFSDDSASAPYNSLIIKFRNPVFVGSYAFTDTDDIVNGSLSSINDAKMTEIKTEVVGADSLTVSVFEDENGLEFPRLFSDFPFASLDEFCVPNNTVANGAESGERFFFMYSDNSGEINFNTQNQNIEAVGNVTYGSDTTNNIGSFVTNEYNSASGITIHGRLNGAAEFLTPSRKVENQDYKVYVQKVQNGQGGGALNLED